VCSRLDPTDAPEHSKAIMPFPLASKRADVRVDTAFAVAVAPAGGQLKVANAFAPSQLPDVVVNPGEHRYKMLRSIVSAPSF
jgi:hypothetical protein